MPLSDLTDFEIKVDGALVSDAVAKAVMEIIVDSSAQLPSMCTVTLHDPELAIVDGTTFDIGKTLDVYTRTVKANVSDTSGALTVIFKGEVTALEPQFRNTGDVMVVRAYDKSHRLHRGKKTRVFAQQTDSGIASTIAGEAGLAADVDTTSITYDWLLQNNQTNMEFLRARAHRIGYQVYCIDAKLFFKKGDYVRTGTPPELKLGTALLTFSPRLTAVQQHDKVEVYGWDPKKKELIKSVKTAPTSTANQGGITDSGGAKASSKFGGSAQVNITGMPLFSMDEGEAIAQATEDEINSAFIQAEGTCIGNPSVIAGGLVKIAGVGAKFSGNYFVTEVRHRWVTNVMYTTRFTISGRQPNTLASLVQSGDGGDGRVRGVVVGLVTNLSDPDDFGRVKVKFPWLPKNNGAEIESTWCRIASPMAGAQRGMYFLPEVNDEVLVGFDHDDISYPYIIGALWNKTDKPPLAAGEAVDNGKVKQRIIKSTSGHVIILDDSSGAEKITIRDKTEKNHIVIDSANNSMTLTVEDALTVTAKGAVTITSSNGDMSLEANNFNVKAKQAVKVEATSTMNLKATSSCTMEGTAGVTIKNAAAEIAMSGPTINMNKGALEVM